MGSISGQVLESGGYASADGALKMRRAGKSPGPEFLLWDRFSNCRNGR